MDDGDHGDAAALLLVDQFYHDRPVGGIERCGRLAAGLIDRGTLAAGKRTDIILVDDEIPLRPRVVAVIAAGRLVHLTEADRLIQTTAAPRKTVAAA